MSTPVKNPSGEFGIVMHACNPRIQRLGEAGDVRGQPGSHSETLSQNKQTKKLKTKGWRCSSVANVPSTAHMTTEKDPLGHQWHLEVFQPNLCVFKFPNSKARCT
jgi:hypothetical protein